MRLMKRGYKIDMEQIREGLPPVELTRIVKCVMYVLFWEFESKKIMAKPKRTHMNFSGSQSTSASSSPMTNTWVTRCFQRAIRMDAFLSESKYVDYGTDAIELCASQLFEPDMSDIEKARIAYEFVRDEIPHSFDCNAKTITARASDVLQEKTGIFHAKANLLAVKCQDVVHIQKMTNREDSRML